ncbi:MAG TPA: alpha/beta family hydrolase [Candidatus Binataceae bacterium]|nr:alpha/beta family hydrolase [Candidatus Binataceae bacterium]
MIANPNDFMVEGPACAPATVILAHGAGAPMDSPFMNVIAAGLAAGGLRVVRFEFPYMRRRRESGQRAAPDREPVLIEAWRDAISKQGGSARLIIGGKSLGGRIASLVADQMNVQGLVCLGYPFHPPGRGAGARIKHLAAIRTPTLIVQGERDPFGSRAEVAAYRLAPAIRIVWLADGDHSFKPRARSGQSEQENLQQAVAAVIEFIGRTTSIS